MQRREVLKGALALGLRLGQEDPTAVRPKEGDLLVKPGDAGNTPLTPEDARRLIQQYVDHYNTVRLHSAIGFITPTDMLAGRQAEIHAARDRKLEEARQQRQRRRQEAA